MKTFDEITKIKAEEHAIAEHGSEPEFGPDRSYARRSFTAGRESTKESLRILLSCWDSIPALKCDVDGFKDRLFDDRHKRVAAFREAVELVKSRGDCP